MNELRASVTNLGAATTTAAAAAQASAAAAEQRLADLEARDQATIVELRERLHAKVGLYKLNPVDVK
jgi:hypothetical protein